jgi:phage baseplate assembly protein W
MTVMPVGRSTARLPTSGPANVTGLRFAHPEFDDYASAGLIASGTGRLETVSGPELIRQSLLLLLSTYPGERVMRPDYGCELLTLTFARNDDTTAGLAIHYVRQAVERFEPRVRIIRVDATRSPESPERLDVLLEYQPKLAGNPETLRVGVVLDSSSS